MTQTVPAALDELIEDFNAVSVKDRLQLLLELSDELDPLPPRFEDHLEQLERVDECQSPLFLAVELTNEQQVQLFFHAPPQSPTTRGFAGILQTGLAGLTATEVLAVPDDIPFRIGLAEAVSPLRLRGMVAMLARIKRQVREKLAA